MVEGFAVGGEAGMAGGRRCGWFAEGRFGWGVVGGLCVLGLVGLVGLIRLFRLGTGSHHIAIGLLFDCCCLGYGFLDSRMWQVCCGWMKKWCCRKKDEQDPKKNDNGMRQNGHE